MGSSFSEGMGQGRVTENLKGAPVDEAFQIPDAEAVALIFDLLKHEGLCLGGSSGINVAGAIRLAKQMGPGHTIVTVLCDYGTPTKQAVQSGLPSRKTCRCRTGWTRWRPRQSSCSARKTSRTLEARKAAISRVSAREGAMSCPRVSTSASGMPVTLLI